MAFKRIHPPLHAWFCLLSVVALKGLYAEAPVSIDRSVAGAAHSFLLIDEARVSQSEQQLIAELESTVTLPLEEWQELRASKLKAIHEDRQVFRRVEFLIEKLRESDWDSRSSMVRLFMVAKQHLALLDQKAQQEEELDELVSEFDRVANLVQRTLDDHRSHMITNAEHRRLRDLVQWLEDHKQAPSLVRLAQQRFSHPNVEVSLSAQMLAALTKQELQKDEPIDRNSDGLTIRGTSRSTGNGFLVPVSDSGRGSLVMRFSGQTDFQMQSAMRRIRFGSSAVTSLNAATRISIADFLTLYAGPTSVCATTNLCNSDATVCRKLGKRLIGRIADRTIAKKTPEFEEELSNEVATRVREELDKEIAGVLSSANSTVSDVLNVRAAWIGMPPRGIQTGTTNERIGLRLLVDALGGLAAPRPCQRRDSDRISVHWTLASSFLNAMYTDYRPRLPRTLNRDMIESWDERLPRLFKEDASPRNVWVDLELDYPRPFSLDFDGNKLSLILRARRILLDDEEETPQQVPYDLAIPYVTEVGPTGTVKFLLAGEPTVEPRDIMPEQDRMRAVREAVLGEFLYGLNPSFEVDPAALAGDSKLPITIRSIESSEGWLSVRFGANVTSNASLNPR
ncbi:MAG: hypothetical protein AAFX06_09840 [Planctomycetota bacterium]